MAKMAAFMLALMCYTLMTSINAFELTASSMEFLPGSTEPLELVCAHPESETTIAKVREIRIRKQNAFGRFVTLASLNHQLNDTFTMMPHVEASGEIGDSPTETRLKVVYNETSREKVGTYLCDLIGIDYFNDLDIETTNSITVKWKIPEMTTQEKLSRAKRWLKRMKAKFDQLEEDNQKKVSALKKEIKRQEGLVEEERRKAAENCLLTKTQVQKVRKEFDIDGTNRLFKSAEELREALFEQCSCSAE